MPTLTERFSRRKLIFFAALLAGITLLFGCQCDSDVLLNNTWVLEQYGTIDSPTDVLESSEITPPRDIEVTLNFGDDKRFGGNDGCNGMFGDYELGNFCQIQFDSIAKTLMLCEEKIMSQASDYTILLKKVESYSIDDDILEMLTPDQEILKYRKK